MTLKMEDIDSNLFSQIGHDGTNLHMKFKSGATYKYLNCPDKHMEGLKNANSPGAYFHEQIHGKYRHSK